MTTEPPDVAAELWALAETVLTRLEPILRQAADEQHERPRQGCSWCPVCALAALLRGEQHDLLTLVATEGATVVAMIRQLVAEHSSGPVSQDHAESAAHAAESAADHTGGGDITRDTEEPVVRRAGFVPITVTIKGSTPADSGDR